jgi:acid phosphatase (class A)
MGGVAIRVRRGGVLLAVLGLLAASTADGQTSGWPRNGEPGSPFPANVNAAPMAQGYLATGAIDSVALLGPPPAVGSLINRADRRRYLETRRLAGTARWRLATEDDDLGAGAFRRFSCAAGGMITPGTTPATFRIMTRIDADTRNVSRPIKEHFSRLRPLMGDRRAACVPRAAWMQTNSSYPSAHAMQGWAWALVLAELLPSRSDALLQNGHEFGESRIVCGVHYPSDVAAGRLLGSALVARLHGEPAFQADLAAARTEWSEWADRPAPLDCRR